MTEKMFVGKEIVESPRGEVPARADDQIFEQYLCNLRIRKDGDPIGDLSRIALAASPDLRFSEFLHRVMTYKNSSLAAIAKQCGIALAEFQIFWRSARVNQAIDKATENLPSLTGDLIDDAKTDESTCPACGGIGQIQREGKEDRICPDCGGKGIIRTIGDRHARKQLLEMTGAIKKEPQVQVNLDMRSVGMKAAATRLQSIPFDVDIKPESE